MAGQQHILVVDDDDGVRATLAACLEAEGFRHSEAPDTKTADTVLAAESVDLVLLDIRMPNEDGLSFMRRLRQHSDLPIILVTALADDIDRVVGLEVGADDYISKPFNRRELIARIRAVLRRSGPRGGASDDRPKKKRFEGWTLDLGRRSLIDPEGGEVTLTRGEFDLLAAFADHPERVMTRDQLMDFTGRGEEAAFDRTVDVMVGRLRRKIEADPRHPRLLVTVHGVGYMFAASVTDAT